VVGGAARGRRRSAPSLAKGFLPRSACRSPNRRFELRPSADASLASWSSRQTKAVTGLGAISMLRSCRDAQLPSIAAGTGIDARAAQ
jgi:hypothetical protein